MQRPELKLVTAEPERRRSRTPAGAAIGAAVLAAAALATALGADAARAPFDPVALAESALARSLAGGDPGPKDEALAALRARLRRTPLDAASRTIEASLAVESAAGEADRDAAAEQAQAAARLAPNEEWVVHAAARVLARCGRTDEAQRAIAGIFAYAPGEAAVALSEIEPFVPEEKLEAGIPRSPGAWLAWSARLRDLGREEEADRRLAALLDRWPDDLDALRYAAGVAAGRDRVDELVRLVPPSRPLPATREAASLWTFRARSKAATGDPAGARADAARAVELAPGDPWVLALAGDAVAGDDAAAARGYWNRALYLLEAQRAPGDPGVWIRYRIARMDDREGRGADALRNWRSILASRPDSAEAKRRIEELTGGSDR